MNRASVTLICLSLTLAACTIGPSLQEFEPARWPIGATANLTIESGVLDENRIVGELLGFQNKGLLLVSPRPVLPGTKGRRIVLVPFSIIRGIRVEHFASFTFNSAGMEGATTQQKRLQLVSRYPQGVSDDLLKALLGGYGQAKLDVVTPVGNDA